MPKLIDMVRNHAPLISGLLSAAGPAGVAAGAVLTSVLGLPKDAPQKQIEEALVKATPDQLLALKKADQDFAVSMRQMDIEEDKVHAGDRDSARRMYAETKDDTPRILSFVIVPAILGYIACITFFELPDNAIQLAREVLFYLAGILTTILSFWFGSSSGSKAKTDALSQMANRQPPK